MTSRFGRQTSRRPDVYGPQLDAARRAVIGDCGEQMYIKEFTFSASCFEPVAAVDLLSVSLAEIEPEMRTLKDRANDTRAKLDSMDVRDWDFFQKKANLLGDLVWMLRSRFDAELCTIAWTKMFEMLSRFELLPHRRPQCTTLHLCEAPGAFVAATNHFLRQCWGDGLRWQWLAQTLNPYYEDNNPLEMLDCDLFILHTVKNWDFGVDNTGNVMNADNVTRLWRRFGRTRPGLQAKSNGCSTSEDVSADHLHCLEPADLVTADGGIDCSACPQEQETIVFKLHLWQSICALGCLARGGSFVLKLYTVYERNTAGLIYLLGSLFDSISLTKPATSKSTNTETYLICKGFRGMSSDALWSLLGKVQRGDTERKALVDESTFSQEFKDTLQGAASALTEWFCSEIERTLVVCKRGLDVYDDAALRQAREEAATDWLERFHVQPLGADEWRLVQDEHLDGQRQSSALRVSNAHGEYRARNLAGLTLTDRQEAQIERTTWRRQYVGQAFSADADRARHAQKGSPTLPAFDSIGTVGQPEPWSYAQLRPSHEQGSADQGIGSYTGTNMEQHNQQRFKGPNDSAASLKVESAATPSAYTFGDSFTLNEDKDKVSDQASVGNGDTIAHLAHNQPKRKAVRPPDHNLEGLRVKRKLPHGADSDDPTSELSFAERTMRRMGYEPGSGLGKDGTGALEPVSATGLPAGSRSGIGYSDVDKTKSAVVRLMARRERLAQHARQYRHETEWAPAGTAELTGFSASSSSASAGGSSTPGLQLPVFEGLDLELHIDQGADNAEHRQAVNNRIQRVLRALARIRGDSMAIVHSTTDQVNVESGAPGTGLEDLEGSEDSGNDDVENTQAEGGMPSAADDEEEDPGGTARFDGPLAGADLLGDAPLFIDTEGPDDEEWLHNGPEPACFQELEDQRRLELERRERCNYEGLAGLGDGDPEAAQHALDLEHRRLNERETSFAAPAPFGPPSEPEVESWPLVHGRPLHAVSNSRVCRPALLISLQRARAMSSVTAFRTLELDGSGNPLPLTDPDMLSPSYDVVKRMLYLAREGVLTPLFQLTVHSLQRNRVQEGESKNMPWIAGEACPPSTHSFRSILPPSISVAPALELLGILASCGGGSELWDVSVGPDTPACEEVLLLGDAGERYQDAMLWQLGLCGRCPTVWQDTGNMAVLDTSMSSAASADSADAAKLRFFLRDELLQDMCRQRQCQDDTAQGHSASDSNDCGEGDDSEVSESSEQRESSLWTHLRRAAGLDSDHRGVAFAVCGIAVEHSTDQGYLTGTAEMGCRRDVIEQLLIALGVLQCGGNLILRVGDTLTRFMMSVLYVLYRSFRRVRIVKPFTISPFVPTRVVICQDFQGACPALQQRLQHVLERLRQDQGDAAATDVLAFVPEDLLHCARFLRHVTHATERILHREVVALTLAASLTCDADGMSSSVDEDLPNLDADSVYLTMSHIEEGLALLRPFSSAELESLYEEA